MAGTITKDQILDGIAPHMADYPANLRFEPAKASPVDVAKTLRDFARTYPALIVKGGMVSGAPLSDQDFSKLADLPSRDVLMARFAGALAAPLQQLAGLLQALPRNFAYGLSALLDERRADEPAPEVAPEPAPAPEVV